MPFDPFRAQARYAWRNRWARLRRESAQTAVHAAALLALALLLGVPAWNARATWGGALAGLLQQWPVAVWLAAVAVMTSSLAATLHALRSAAQRDWLAALPIPPARRRRRAGDAVLREALGFALAGGTALLAAGSKPMAFVALGGALAAAIGFAACAAWWSAWRAGLRQGRAAPSRGADAHAALRAAIDDSAGGQRREVRAAGDGDDLRGGRDPQSAMQGSRNQVRAGNESDALDAEGPRDAGDRRGVGEVHDSFVRRATIGTGDLDPARGRSKAHGSTVTSDDSNAHDSALPRGNSNAHGPALPRDNSNTHGTALPRGHSSERRSGLARNNTGVRGAWSSVVADRGAGRLWRWQRLACGVALHGRTLAWGALAWLAVPMGSGLGAAFVTGVAGVSLALLVGAWRRSLAVLPQAQRWLEAQPLAPARLLRATWAIPALVLALAIAAAAGVLLTLGTPGLALFAALALFAFGALQFAATAAERRRPARGALAFLVHAALLVGVLQAFAIAAVPLWMVQMTMLLRRARR